MTRLFDENLSPTLPALIEVTFHGSRHVRDCGLKGKTDREVWDYDRRENLFRRILISFSAASFTGHRQSYLAAYRKLYPGRPPRIDPLAPTRYSEL